MSIQRGAPVLALLMLVLSSFISMAVPVLGDETGGENVPVCVPDSVEFRFEFDPSGVQFYDVDGLVGIKKDGFDISGVPGEPFVPVSLRSFVLDPYALDIEVEITSKSFTKLPWKGPILGVPEQVPIGDPQEIPLKGYSISLDGPVRLLDSGYIRGHLIQEIAFQPVIPRVDGTLEIYESVEGEIRFSRPVAMEKISNIDRPSSVFGKYLSRSLENPGDLDRFMARPLSSPAASPIQEDDVQYVIITDTSKVGTHLSKLSDWKMQKGVPSRIVEMSFILSNYNGTDNQEKVRNFITDAVSMWETEYILLGGDISVVPYRSTYVRSGSYTETDCAADLYYSDLDGTFNADNDTTYGEVSDNVDLRPDVIVGRAPAQTSSEMDTFVTKTLKYEIDPLTGYLDNMTLAGEYLDANTNSSIGMDVIKTTLLPSNVNATSLYDSAQGVFGNLNRPNFMGQVDKGLSYAWHSGHSNYNVMSVGTASNGYMYSSNIQSYNGGYKIGVMNSLGCIANRFSVNDCIGELHVMEADGGSVVFIGNSRYGWYAPYSPGYGTSEVYMREMATELFTNGNTNMGAHFALAKDSMVGWSGSDNSYRWLQMALNMMGEPEMHVRTAEPSVFNITLPVNIGRSYPDFYITVNDGNGLPIKDALVCLQQTGYYGYNVSGTNGRAYFNFSTSNFDKANVTVTGYNFLPFRGNISIDIRPPTMVMNSLGNATTGDDYEFNCTVSDESGIQSVFLDIRTASQDVNDTTVRPMVNIGDDWTVNITAPYNSTDALIYRIRGRDNSGNWNETGWGQVDVLDNDLPWFMEDTSSVEGTTGETILFNISADDNIGVSSVLLNVSWEGSDSAESVEMTKVGALWTGTWSVPSDRIGVLSYSSVVYDGAGNLNDSLTGSIEILDNDAPVFFEDLTDPDAATSDEYVFRVTVEDNLGLEAVFVEFWRGNYPEHDTMPMVEIEGVWSYSIELPPDDLDSVYHLFHAVDTSGNWNHTTDIPVPVTDKDPPVFMDDWSPESVTTGEPVTMVITVIDNIRVGSVVLFASTMENPMEMEVQPDGSNWTAEMIAPETSTEPITYWFQAWDPYDNTMISEERTINVIDNDAPTFGDVLVSEEVDAGDNLTVSAKISDNIGMDEAELEWWLGGTLDKMTMAMVEGPGGYSAAFQIPIEAYGTVYFRIHATDINGNTGTSDRFDSSIIEYVPLDITDDDDDDIIGPDDDDDVIDDDSTSDDDETSIPSAGSDCDKDGMDDLWEYNNGLSVGVDDSGSDADEDGFSNLVEYQKGTDPKDDLSFPTSGKDGGNGDPSDLLIYIVIGVVVVGLLIVIAVALMARKRHPSAGGAEMVLDDDEDDEVMSWD
ncbi:MAG: C25 family cysteine peptidase [Thermoplasmatota archaeon]